MNFRFLNRNVNKLWWANCFWGWSYHMLLSNDMLLRNKWLCNNDRQVLCDLLLLNDRLVNEYRWSYNLRRVSLLWFNLIIFGRPLLPRSISSTSSNSWALLRSKFSWFHVYLSFRFLVLNYRRTFYLCDCDFRFSQLDQSWFLLNILLQCLFFRWFWVCLRCSSLISNIVIGFNRCFKRLNRCYIDCLGHWF